MDAIKVHKELFWIPNQVYREYLRNASQKKKNIEKLFSDARAYSVNEIETSKQRVVQKLTTLRKQNQIMDDSLKSKIEEKYSELIRTIKDGYRALETDYENDIKIIKEDNILDKLVDEVYGASAHEDFSIIEKMRICEEGEIRYKYKIAPGFTDVTKPESTEDYFRKYGDLIIWKEMLRRVDGKSINIIFVQDEKKQDWLATKGGTVLANVLIEEYKIATCGQGTIQVCNLEGFIDNYGEDLGLKAAEIEKLVKMLQMERSVYEYIADKRNVIANAEIDDYFNGLCDLNDIVYQFGGCSVYGGNFENAENPEVSNINIESCVVKYQKDLGMFFIYTRFEVQGNTDIEEYVGRDVRYVGNADFTIRGKLVQKITMAYDNMEVEPQKGFEIVSADFDFEDLVFYNETDFEVEMRYEDI